MLARSLLSKLWLLVVLLVVWASPVFATDYDRFIGVYDGEALLQADGEMAMRDLRVSIDKTEAGFNLTWTLVTHKSGGKVKRQEYSINFEPSRRDGIYSSAMQRNVFGRQTPMDPLKGDPYVWARILANEITVYALIILDDGGYEMQEWVRTLTDDGMHLEFSRVRNGEVLRTVEGQLQRR